MDSANSINLNCENGSTDMSTAERTNCCGRVGCHGQHVRLPISVLISSRKACWDAGRSGCLSVHRKLLSRNPHYRCSNSCTTVDCRYIVCHISGLFVLQCLLLPVLACNLKCKTSASISYRQTTRATVLVATAIPLDFTFL